MIYLLNDYSQGAHPKILQALSETNDEHTPGYGVDDYCNEARQLIRQWAQAPEAEVHFFVGGTITNATAIAHMLRPFEGVIGVQSAHIHTAETGAVEAHGHRVIVVPGRDGKIRPENIEALMNERFDEHCVVPKALYISQPTELGSLYHLDELTRLREIADRYGLFLYVDGARLGSALASPDNDVSMADLARLSDAFYIGGTKNGALFGEALVIVNPALQPQARHMMKRSGALFAKGRLLGVQFKALLEGEMDSLYVQIGREINTKMARIQQTLLSHGIEPNVRTSVGLVYVDLESDVVAQLQKSLVMSTHRINDHVQKVRFVVGFGTTDEDIEAFEKALANALNRPWI